uniref:Uncharacterized protein n=1 Tax=Arundo donax TaxID=35708 RepID=A0A0A9HNZ3_ARUDO
MPYATSTVNMYHILILQAAEQQTPYLPSFSFFFGRCTSFYHAQEDKTVTLRQ